MADTPITSPDILAVGMARELDDILHRYMQHCLEQEVNYSYTSLPKDEGSEGRYLTRHGLTDNPPCWVAAVNQAKRDPVRFALRTQAREIAWRAYAIWGEDFSDKIYDLDIIDPDSTLYLPWHLILDRWWRGIGAPLKERV